MSHSPTARPTLLRTGRQNSPTTPRRWTNCQAANNKSSLQLDKRHFILAKQICGNTTSIPSAASLPCSNLARQPWFPYFAAPRIPLCVVFNAPRLRMGCVCVCMTKRKRTKTQSVCPPSDRTNTTPLLPPRAKSLQVHQANDRTG